MWSRRFCSRTRCKNSKVLCYTYYIFNGPRSVVGYRPPKKQSVCVVTSYLRTNANLLSFSPCLKLRGLNSHWLWPCVVIVGRGKPLYPLAWCTSSVGNVLPLSAFLTPPPLPLHPPSS